MFFCTVEFANVYAAFLEINVQLEKLKCVFGLCLVRTKTC